MNETVLKIVDGLIADLPEAIALWQSLRPFLLVNHSLMAQPTVMSSFQSVASDVHQQVDNSIFREKQEQETEMKPTVADTDPVANHDQNVDTNSENDQHE